MRRREYGGYLPFETCEGKDYFSRFGEERVLRTNSGKAAIYVALQAIHPRRLYVPHYICDSVNRMLAEMEIPVERYDLNEELLPRLGSVKEDEAVLLVNYYGVMEERMRAEAEKYPMVILDQTHAFFAEPIFRRGAWSVYSCRKFIGVPDGGYLVGEAVPQRELEPDQVSGAFSYLVTSFEQGTNAAYSEKRVSDRRFVGHYAGMSRISQGMLSGVNYAHLRTVREENFRCLQERLEPYNQLRLPDAKAAWMYPFWPKSGGAALKKALVADRIYTPTLWRELICPERAGTLEYRLSDEMVFLPVDQRYGREDMEYLAERVLELGGYR